VTAAHTNRGKTTERAVAAWFRTHGFPGGERIRRTGYATLNRETPDESDIAIAPGLIAQVKALRPANRAERAIPGWLTQAEAQRVAARADLCLLIVRRDGTADVGEWWCWLTTAQLITLNGATFTDYRLDPDPDMPVRVQVAHIAPLLQAAGYGNPPDTTNGVA